MSLKDIEPSGAEKVGFYRINEILAKNDRSEIEERILASVQWASRAAVELQQRPEEAFLHYAIALETIILGSQQNMVSSIWEKSAEVRIQIDNVSIENEEDWPQMAKFHADWSKKFYDVIVPYIAAA